MHAFLLAVIEPSGRSDGPVRGPLGSQPSSTETSRHMKRLLMPRSSAKGVPPASVLSTSAEPGPSRRLSVGRCKTPSGAHAGGMVGDSLDGITDPPRMSSAFSAPPCTSSDQGAPVGSAWGNPVRLRRTHSASKVLAVHLSVAVVAALLTLLILWDAFQTIVLSRRVVRRFTPTRAFYRLLWTPWRAVARRLPEGNLRESVLTVFGPLSLLLLIASWALGLIVSFALLHWGLGSQLLDAHGASGFGVDLYMSGTTFVTLGLGDVTPSTSVARLLTVLES